VDSHAGVPVLGKTTWPGYDMAFCIIPDIIRDLFYYLFHRGYTTGHNKNIQNSIHNPLQVDTFSFFFFVAV